MLTDRRTTVVGVQELLVVRAYDMGLDTLWLLTQKILMAQEIALNTRSAMSVKGGCSLADCVRRPCPSQLCLEGALPSVAVVSGVCLWIGRHAGVRQAVMTAATCFLVSG